MRSVETVFGIAKIGKFTMLYRTCCRRFCSTNEAYTITRKKEIHPYRRIHPWKSETEFANSLLKNIIYNADGIVAINKPYGISVIDQFLDNTTQIAKRCHKIVGAANYSIQNVLPYIAKELDVPVLIPCLGSEKYMTGIYVFGINNEVCNQIRKASVRAIHLGKFRKYWGVTIRIPHEIKGSYHLGLTLQQSSLGNKKPVILTNWSNNAVKRDEVKILNVHYKLLSNSTHNLSSLVEIMASAKQWHAIRLFTSTIIYSPILGDNYHGSRVQEIMGTWMRVNPFAESCWNLPKLNPQLLELLNLTPSQQEIIPAHIHLRGVSLISFGKEKKNIILEAPLMHPFDWTCKRLMFKNVSYKESHASMEDKDTNIVLQSL